MTLELNHILVHSLEHMVGVVPLLFVVFLILEYIEHCFSDRHKKFIKASRSTGPLWGAAFGIIPQCGFSVFVTNLFCGRVATFGTLVAVYLATSDEMLPVMISGGISLKVCTQILILKGIIAIIFGYLADMVFKVRSFSRSDINDLCTAENCRCKEKSMLYGVLSHTLKTTIFLFATTVLLNCIVEAIGQETLKNIISNMGIFSVVISTLAGFIPNCASSIVITQLFVEGAIPFGTMLSGLLSGAGLGWLVLIRYNYNKKETLTVIVYVFAVSVICGIFANLIA